MLNFSITIRTGENSCQKQIEQLKSEISSCEAERKKLKNEYFDLLMVNLQKDVEINEMEKKTGSSTFDEFKNDLSSEAIDKLSIIGSEEKYDSKFILTVVRDLYGGKLNELSKKSVTGRAKVENTKESITPTKMTIITKIFEKRVSGSSKGIERKKNVNKHIKTAIQNIVKVGH